VQVHQHVGREPSGKKFNELILMDNVRVTSRTCTPVPVPVPVLVPVPVRVSVSVFECVSAPQRD
jgi:hypothetical protein